MMMSDAKQTASAANSFNQAISLLTTSGTLELEVMAVGAGADWVLPLTLVLGCVEITSADLNAQKLTWQDAKIPLIKLAAESFSHALIIEGVQDGLRYAIAMKEIPLTRKIRISALKDIEKIGDFLKNHSKNKYVYQYVQHEEQIWIVPDLDALELTLTKH
jgi:hypothetical protein